MTKKNKPFPLSNCFPITLAAKQIGCEVGDVIRYGIEGSINLLVNIDECETPVYGFVSDFTNRLTDNHWQVRLSGGFAYYGEIQQTDDPNIVKARLGGVWGVNHSDIQVNQTRHPPLKLGLFAQENIFKNNYLHDARAQITVMDSPFPDYWITHEDLLLLEALMIFEDPSSKIHKEIKAPEKILLEQVGCLTEKIHQLCSQTDILTHLLEQAEEEIAKLKDQIAMPEYMNPQHPRYAPKLAASVQSWIAYEPIPSKSPKQSLAKWLKDNAEKYPNIDGKPLSGFDELAAVANWSTKGGAPKTPTEK